MLKKLGNLINNNTEFNHFSIKKIMKNINQLLICFFFYILYIYKQYL